MTLGLSGASPHQFGLKALGYSVRPFHGQMTTCQPAHQSPIPITFHLSPITFRSLVRNTHPSHASERNAYSTNAQELTGPVDSAEARDTPSQPQSRGQRHSPQLSCRSVPKQKDHDLEPKPHRLHPDQASETVQQ